MANVKKGTKKPKKKSTKVTETGKVYIYAGFNNTLVTITDPEGNTLFSGSAGAAGFKGSRKSTPYAASVAAEDLGRKAVSAGMEEVSVIVKGPGYGRIPAIKSLKTAGLKVVSISDVTPIPHNGCRPKKIRRV
ncbi:MAG TPA: 30S ribosomal protein S11 [candidate division WWE3 bacterium]|uniref:Small ribosomal subunit protein uS11 n=1 Tax=candidate division WWE3 bacterium TaxID=2053526 RepID=A0A7C1DIC1_UNCKA|nr:30S ribosomal protein S11 [candidate division WWE3 bacterium]